MIKRKPTVISSEINEFDALLVLYIDEDILDFSGHFADFPLLPGVSQIDWAFYYAKNMLKIEGVFTGMEVVKFQEPIRPKAQVLLTLKWDKSKQKLDFSYTSKSQGKVMIHSSGKMSVGVSSEAV